MQDSPSSEEIQKLISLFKDGQMHELEPLAKDFSQRYSWHGLGWMLLGAVYRADKRNEEALTAQLKAIEIMPPKAELYSNLGNIQFALDQLSDAENSYRLCLKLDRQNINGLYNYGLLLLKANRPREAERHFRSALALDSKSAEIIYHTAKSLLIQKQFSEAVLLLQKVLDIRSDYSGAHDSLSYAYLNLGQFDSAIRYGYAAKELGPQDAEVLGNLLFTLNYAIDRSSAAIDLARAYGKLVSEKTTNQRLSDWNVTAKPEKLKIGLVSGDFKNHPVAYFLLSLLCNADKKKLEFFAYSTIKFEDFYTQKIKAETRSWAVLSQTSDLVAAKQIQADGIHILIDLSGHTGHGRLPVFSFKPAPIQISWLGYFSTTGLPEMDYVLADMIGIPEHDKTQFTEKVCYLPETRLCFTPPEMAPVVKPSPVNKNKHITFGCYQNVAKVNDQVLQCWSSILSVLPKAKLRWQCTQFLDLGVQKLISSRLRQYGIPEKRVRLINGEGRQDYLDSYRNVDIVLDTFPFPGGTTTCEALWMGVPTLTLAGQSLLSRQGASILTAAGLSNWVAFSTDEYLEKAVAFAKDTAALSDLRLKMRHNIEETPLFNGKRFAQNFELTMWKIWSQNSPIK